MPKLDVAEAIVDLRGVVCLVERKYGSKVYWRWRSERWSTVTISDACRVLVRELKSDDGRGVVVIKEALGLGWMGREVAYRRVCQEQSIEEGRCGYRRQANFSAAATGSGSLGRAL